MTIRMPDSITPTNINMIDAKAAVLGYVDGNWPTAPRLHALFPGAKVIALTVLGETLDADGIDCEPGNPFTAVQAADWLKRKLASTPASRPVAYADLASPGYSMSEIVAELARLGIARARVRLLPAHYDGEHICSAARGCRDKDNQLITFTADGTQWTKTYPGVGGQQVDMSLLNDSFFAPAPNPADWIFSTPRGLAAKPGHTNVELSWSSPSGPAPEAVHHYQVTVRHEGQDVAGYPRDVPKGPNPEVHSFGSLAQGTAYEAMVRAVAVNGHASSWAVSDFTTGHG